MAASALRGPAGSRASRCQPPWRAQPPASRRRRPQWDVSSGECGHRGERRRGSAGGFLQPSTGTSMRAIYRGRRHVALVAALAFGEIHPSRIFEAASGRAARPPTSSSPNWAAGIRTTTCCTTARQHDRQLQPEVRCEHGAIRRAQLGGWTARAHRRAAGRCRHAPVVARRLDAQPGADGGGVLPDQEHGIDWRQGAGVVQPHLVDADLASTRWAGNGSRATAWTRRRFRIFNPVAQSRRFDPQGRYIRRWFPS